MSEAEQPVFSIEKIYVKDMSLEIPNAPQIFLVREQPAVEVQLHSQGAKVDEGVYEVTLTITVTAKVGEKTMFLTETAQAGIFQIRNVPEQEMDAVLSIGCPNILFPYAREVISSTIARAGFPPVVLAPVNFEALYFQRLQEQQKQGKPGDGIIQLQ
ncbi:MAG: protein-export chaperone SecB [Rhodocyclaceae bacterium]|nr:protein-export chaperone SecB [Rhodocyclaceae bacterium]MBX3668980.1 protein-export chaperone SecB [Rhodocyclaceae bacterium]